MTRAEKILNFMSTAWGGRRWCTADVCGCMGCVNASLRNQWLLQSNEEMPISKDEFYETLAKLPPEDRKPISFSFRSYDGSKQPPYLADEAGLTK